MPARVAFISPSGFGNLGDAAIIDSLIGGVRARLPGVEIVGFTLNPSDTAVRHGVEASTCGAFALPHYPMRRTPRADSEDDDATDDTPGPAPLGRRLRHAIAELPGARRSRRAVGMGLAELRHRREIAARIRGFDHVVVAGGGQLDDLWGGPFGHPYTLYRWSAAAHRAGARFSVLSVGTGNLATALSRKLVARALANASYHSFRDARSRELAAAAGATPADPIVPDLAYGLPLAPLAPAPRARPAIGIAPMCYADPRVWPKPDAARYAHHITSFAQLAIRAARAGHDVVLFVTDRPDREPLAECNAQVQAALAAPERARVRVVTPDRTTELMALIGGLDVVVAARFHGVLLSHVAGKPVLGVAHERKVTTLMTELGHERFCVPIDELDPADATARIAELLRDRDALGAHIHEVAAGYRRRVEDQYDLVFGRPS